jgi:hypothetical protein
MLTIVRPEGAADAARRILPPQLPLREEQFLSASVLPG